MAPPSRATTRAKLHGTRALVTSNLCYWAHVAPLTRAELHRWQRRADEIPDPVLRGHARSKLCQERFNAEVAATLATLAPAHHRAATTTAIVAFQVMYDYLDGVSEQPNADPIANGRQLFTAFADALTPGAPGHDYYRHHPHGDDGGYLRALTTTCSRQLAGLPRADVALPRARTVAASCGEAQVLTHAIPSRGTAPLAAWAAPRAARHGLRWWEYAAGAAASSLTTHALIAAAADPATGRADATDISRAYLFACALSTLLDSLVDRAEDERAGRHSYVSYYANAADMSNSIASIAARACDEARQLRHGAHHAMTAAGVAGYYLSNPQARTPSARATTQQVTRQIGLLIRPILVIFRVWRAVKSAGRRSSPSTRRRPISTAPLPPTTATRWFGPVGRR